MIMARDILKLLREIRYEFAKSIFLNSFLDSVLLFLILYFALSLFRLFPLIALIPAAVFFYLHFRKRMRQIQLKTVEDEHPSVKEMLRTAADNVSYENIVIRELNRELLSKMKGFSSSLLLRFKKIAYRVSAIVVLSFVTVFFAATNIYVYDAGRFFTATPYIDFFDDALEGEGYQDIYGDPNVGELGDEEINLEIVAASYEIDISDVREAEKKIFKSQFPDEVYAAAEESFEAAVSPEDILIVKNYFEKVR